MQHGEQGIHKGWLNQTELFWPEGVATRDIYVSYVYWKLFTTNHAHLSQNNVNCYPLAMFLYGLSEPVVEEGILKIAQNSPSSLIGHIDSLTCCVPNYSPVLDSFESITSTLLTYDIFPRLLDVSVSSCDNLVAVGSNSDRSYQLEQIFACSAVTEQLYVTLNDRLSDDVVTATRILSGLASCQDSQLSTLHLTRVAEVTLSSVAPSLVSPRFFLKIKSLSLNLFHGSEGFVPPLIEILQHQISLETLSLSFDRTTCGSLGHNLVSSLSQLFSYPNFKEMELKQQIDFPVVGVISAFLRSSANHQQILRLSHQRLALSSGHPDLNFELPTAEHSQQCGPQRDLVFENVTASRSFYDWLFSMPCLCLNSLRFKHCKAIDDGGSKLKLGTKLEAHPNASVSHYNNKMFGYVPW